MKYFLLLSLLAAPATYAQLNPTTRDTLTLPKGLSVCTTLKAAQTMEAAGGIDQLPIYYLGMTCFDLRRSIAARLITEIGNVTEFRPIVRQRLGSASSWWVPNSRPRIATLLAQESNTASTGAGEKP